MASVPTPPLSPDKTNQNNTLVVSSMTIITHNSLCSTRAYHLRIDLARMPLLGIVAWKTKKILRTRNDLSMEMHSNEGESVSTYPRRL